MRDEILRLENLSQQINGEYCLKDINMYILKGEIVGLLVPEAKGKKELIQILEKNIPITHGKVYIDGHMVNSYIHSDLSNNKIYVIGQKSTLVDDLNIADNLFVLRRGVKKKIINKKILRSQTVRLMEEFGLSLKPDTVVMRLKPINRCMVELIRAYLMGCGLVVLNNCNSFLGEEDIALLQNMVRKFCCRGIAFLYMGNHHEEVFKICHRAILLSDGQIKKKFFRNEMDDDHIQPYIIKFGTTSSQKKQNVQKEILKINNVTYGNLNDFSLTLRKGECVTLLVNDNNVSNAFLDLLKGGERPDMGEILLQDEIYTSKMSRRAMDSGVAIIQEDPIHTMIFPELSVIENLAFLMDKKIGGIVAKKCHYESVRKEYYFFMGDAIKEKNIANLTQKELYCLIYCRIHLYHPKVVVCVSPFAHGDMQCRQNVLKMIQELKKIGVSILILQVNISDSMSVSDRLLVMSDGKIVKAYNKEEFYLIKR